MYGATPAWKCRTPHYVDEDIVYSVWKHTVLCAHPRKTQNGAKIENDDVSGSSAITNLADTVITVSKPNL